MAPARGAFVVVIGPDGVGKTSLAARLIADHGAPTMYLHFRPSLRTPPPSSPIEAGIPPPKQNDPGPRPLGWLRLARSVGMFWLGYLRWIRPALARGTLVVGDRWFYGYVGQPVALGFGGPPWLARLATRIAPHPDLVVRLTAPAEIVAKRKSDLTAAEIQVEIRKWETLPLDVWVLDSSMDVSSLADAVAARLAGTTRG
ncbi:MAG TPA: hypothetical protein VM848_17350 [Acidimicrobiia bacterium]|nr:hypothetical protein [Acidimicrobiia bacterium]